MSDLVEFLRIYQIATTDRLLSYSLTLIDTP